MPETDPGGRLPAWGQALREWALAHPESSRLFYGQPVPGYRPPEEGPDQAARRVCRELTRLVAEARPQARHRQPEGPPGPTSTRNTPRRSRRTSRPCPSPRRHSRCAYGAGCTAWRPSRSTATSAP
nr:TetR-like C-terminal domain-containing protein [Streptomyces sp. WAC 06738]